jgi:hypothetical protein
MSVGAAGAAVPHIRYPSDKVLHREDSHGGIENQPGLLGNRGYIRPSESSQGIWERSIKIIQGTQVIIEQAQHLKTVLGTSKGRDKICSMIQYISKFVYKCQIHSNIEEIQAGLR